MQQYPPNQPPEFPTQPYPAYPAYPQQPPPAPPPKKKPPRWAMGCAWAILAVVVLALCAGIYNLTLGRQVSASSPTPTAVTQSQATTPTQVKPTATSKPHAIYPPKSKADLQALATLGDPSALATFDSESVGMVGACPQPKREVAASSSLTGKRLAEDLLAYFFGQQMDSPCGSLLLAYHSRAEAATADGYTVGRVLLDTDNPNDDPNATNITYTLTLDLGNVQGSNQEYIISWKQ